jgi:hypothetical protein
MAAQDHASNGISADPAQARNKLIADIKALGKTIRSVEIINYDQGPLKGDVVRVTYFDADSWGDSAFMFLASHNYAKAGQLVANQAAVYSGVQFLVKTMQVDEYKRESEGLAFVLSLPSSELAKINWENFVGADMLRLSDVDTKSLGRGIKRAYCQDYGQDAGRFCR